MMGKKFKEIKWASVALEGFPISKESFNGFVGLEECTEYGFLDKETKKAQIAKKAQKTKQVKERKRKSNQPESEVLSKRTKHCTVAGKEKLSNGFIVETCEKAKPSLGENAKATRKKNKKMKKTNDKTGTSDQKTEAKRTKPKLGVNIVESASQLTLEEMDAWSSFQIPDEILRALAEQGFKKPSKIQELVLPPAMLGRRDILGAAQTGSGKTLAFGIPILAGIMKLKEQAESGVDVYEMPYKKSSAKKKVKTETVPKKVFSKKNNNRKTNSKNVVSSEEGYSSGDYEENKVVADDSDKEDGDDENLSNQETEDENDEDKESDEETSQEYNVPLKKKALSDTGNESEDSDDNYVHLSDILDSDDVADSSDGENDYVEGKDDGIESDEDTDSQNECLEEEAQNEDDIDDGVGCVKVIDDIELPGPVVRKTGKPLYALILTPTRELAMQISQHLISAAKYTGIRIATVVGGLAAVKQERVLSKGPEVVVATPGRLWELLRQGQPHLEQVDNVKFLAIDETDRMLERGHFTELKPLLERLNSRARKRQSFVMSATLTIVHRLPTRLTGNKVTKRGKIINRKVTELTSENKIKKLVSMIGMTDPKVVDITADNLGAAETLTECRIACSLDQKDHYLYYILKRHPGRTIVFCNSIGSVKRLAQLFGLLKCSPLPLHASMPQRQRLKNLERFRDDPRGVLVATDVAARGLDIPDVDHVVHYQVPRTAENYVHRSGRTARANKEGLTIVLMDPSEAINYTKLCRTLNKKTEPPTFPVPAHLLNSMKEVVTAARELDRLQLSHRRAAQESGWLDKAARDMDIIVDEDFLPRQHIETTTSKVLQQKKKQLDALISRPLFPRGFSYKFPTLNDPSALTARSEENALTVMKNAIESGSLKRERRKSKNAPLLKLQKDLKKK